MNADCGQGTPTFHSDLTVSRRLTRKHSNNGNSYCSNDKNYALRFFVIINLLSKIDVMTRQIDLITGALKELKAKLKKQLEIVPLRFVYASVRQLQPY